MDIEQALRAHLLAHVGLAALVGSRVYPLLVPKDAALPAVTYQRISTVPTQHRGSVEHGRIRMQIDGWAGSFGGAVALREQIRDAMAQFRRTAAPRVDVALLQDDRDLREPDSERWRASMDYMIYSTED